MHKNKKPQKKIESTDLEAVLFTMGDPIKVTKLARIFDTTVGKMTTVISELKKYYISEKRGLTIVTHENTVQIATSKSAQDIIEKTITDTRNEDLSRAALEVLAIVAYRGNVSRMDVDAIRGVNSSFSLRNLLIRGLIKRVKNTENTQKTYLYCVTNDFLTHLGISSIKSLPYFNELNTNKKVSQAVGVNSIAS